MRKINTDFVIADIVSIIGDEKLKQEHIDFIQSTKTTLQVLITTFDYKKDINSIVIRAYRNKLYITINCGLIYMFDILNDDTLFIVCKDKNYIYEYYNSIILHMKKDLKDILKQVNRFLDKLKDIEDDKKYNKYYF